MSKLVRDKIPTIIKDSGKFPVTHYLDPIEYTSALHSKLFEEAQELVDVDRFDRTSHSAQSKEDILEEAADVLEVLLAILKHQGYLDPLDHLLEKRYKKLAERGGFSDGISLVDVKDKISYEF